MLYGEEIIEAQGQRNEVTDEEVSQGLTLSLFNLCNN